MSFIFMENPYGVFHWPNKLRKLAFDDMSYNYFFSHSSPLIIWLFVRLFFPCRKFLNFNLSKSLIFLFVVFAFCVTLKMALSPQIIFKNHSTFPWILPWFYFYITDPGSFHFLYQHPQFAGFGPLGHKMVVSPQVSSLHPEKQAADRVKGQKDEEFGLLSLFLWKSYPGSSDENICFHWLARTESHGHS